MLRRTIGITAAAAAVTVASVAPANADAPSGLESYEAAATATALEITVLGQQLAVSQTQAELNSTPSSAADGEPLLILGETPGDDAFIQAPPGGTNQSCVLELNLGDLTGGAVTLADAGLVCVDTEAHITDGAPFAQSSTGELTIRVTAPGGQLVEPLLGPVLDAVTQLTDPIVEALGPLLGIIEDITDIDVEAVLDDLITALGDDLFVLAEIVVAPTLSRVSADAENGVVAEAGANAVTINLLPGIETVLDTLVGLVDIEDPNEGPLLSVTLSQATASVVRDPVTAAAAPDASAAQLVDITVDDQLGILEGITGTVTDLIDGLAADQLACDGGVLADILCIDLGSVNELDAAELAARNMDFGEGTVGREASAANIELLPIAADLLGGEVLGLSLGRATAAANATVAAAPGPGPLPGSPAEPAGPTLPRTGGESTLPLTLGLLAVGSAGALLLRRARTV